MNFPLFIARRIYSDKGDRRKVSRPAIHIATVGVAIGLAVMILTVSVVLGFKHTIRDKVIGFGSHIQVCNFLAMQTTDSYPICIDDSTLNALRHIDGISHAERYATAQGILKTETDFLGIAFKGVAEEYNWDFIRQNLVSGEIPKFSDKSASNKLLVSTNTASTLHLKVGDRIYGYFVSDTGVRARRFTVSGIYETNMSQFDNSLCFTDLYTTRKVNGWEEGQCSGAELRVSDFSRLETTATGVVKKVNRKTDRYGDVMISQTIYEAYPQIFSWLSLLDINVWIILVLMICVAGFTMISGLLIIILERTQMIGTLKALGAKNSSIRHTFLWFAVFVIGRGVVFGNLAAIALIVLQKTTGIVSLDPATYYVSEAPMEVNIPAFVVLNVVTVAVSILILIAPSYLISHIHPAKSMRYE
ncbi:MAG: ABC transporter permease [Prevotellaceae bacterium]|nr:ABC transporter permease [Prevotellaceae bacterium]